MNSKIEEIVKELREYAPDEDGVQRYILIPAAGRGAIAEYPVTVRSHRTDVMRDAADLIEQLRQELSKLRAQQRWIPVTERLPDDDDDVLIMSSGSRSMGYYSVYNEYWADYINVYYDDVTHWMPLPEAPKE